MADNFHGSGLSDNHFLWAGIGLAAGFLMKANGWGEWVLDEATGKRRFVAHWKAFASDWTSAGMIFVLALGLIAVFPLIGLGSLPPLAGTLLVGVLFLVGLRPLTEKLHAFFDALIARARGRAS